MARPSKLQLYVSTDLYDRVRRSAHDAGVSVSEWLRSALAQACEDPGSCGSVVGDPARIARQSTFVMVGIDALLAGHPDPTLRERAHQAFARKCRLLGLPLANEEGA